MGKEFPYRLKRPIYIVVGACAFIILLGWFAPSELTNIIPFPEEYTYATVIGYITCFATLMWSLELFGSFVAFPFEYAFIKRKVILQRLFKPIKASASLKGEVAGIIDSFMMIIGIFALIFAASGDWGRFVFFVFVGSGMIFFAGWLRR